MPKWILFSILFLSFIATLLINEAFLPDYVSYYRIFYNTGTLYDELWRSDPGFYFLNRICNDLGLSYDNFRILARIASITLFCYSLYRLSYKSKNTFITSRSLDSYSFNKDKKRDFYLEKNTILFSIFMLFFLLVFLFEFYFVRIRAGLSISIFLFALSFLWGRSYLNLPSIFGFSILLLLASSIHFTTVMVLVLMIAIPLIFSISTKFSIKSFKFSKKATDRFNVLILGICGFIVLYVSTTLAALRGEWLFIELNVVRLLSLFVTPYLIFFAYRLFSKTAFKDSDIHNIGAANALRTKEKFYQYCLKGYLLFVLYLPFYYVLGLTENNGEAIVRIYTLSSVIALVILFTLPRKEDRNFWYLLGFTHSAFFINSNFDLLILLPNLF